MALGDVLPPALAVAMSPIAVTTVILLLLGGRSSTKGAAYALGWAAGLASIAVIVLAYAGFVGVSASGRASTLGASVRLLVGAGLFALAYLQWHKRPAPGTREAPPPWLSSAESVLPAKALEMGAVESALNAKNVMLTLAAALTVAESATTATQTVVLVSTYVFLGTMLVLAPVVAFVIYGQRVTTALAGVMVWVQVNTATIMAGVLVMQGVMQLSRALGSLIPAG
jgi:hypothetical protein